MSALLDPAQATRLRHAEAMWLAQCAARLRGSSRRRQRTSVEPVETPSTQEASR